MPWCPQCGAEYREEFTRCSECDVPLVASLPEETPLGEAGVIVAAFSDHQEARLVRGVLDEEGIPCGLIDRHFHAYPVSTGVLGDVLLAVPPSWEQRAREVLRTLRRRAPEDGGPDDDA